MTYIINTEAIVIFIGAKRVRIEKSDKRYAKIIGVFDLPKEDQDEAVLAILEPETVDIKKIHGLNGFEVVEDDVYYKGDKLPPAMATKIQSILRDGLPLEHFEKFWENLELNPTASSVSELMNFLSYKELPITEDGCFLAYKGLQDDYWSISGNKDTKVVSGQVDDTGRIFNGIGEYIEVRRRDVDDNRNHHCSFGLHVGSLSYASNFGRGKLVVVKVNPKDVVSVPTDYSCQKCRVSAYTVLYDFEGEIEASVVDSDGESTIVPDTTQVRTDFVGRVANYLDNKRDEGYDGVTLRQIQAIFSPEWPSKERVIDALQALCENWFVSDEGITICEL
jgi:hypothetical protein